VVKNIFQKSPFLSFKLHFHNPLKIQPNKKSVQPGWKKVKYFRNAGNGSIANVIRRLGRFWALNNSEKQYIYRGREKGMALHHIWEG